MQVISTGASLAVGFMETALLVWISGGLLLTSSGMVTEARIKAVVLEVLVGVVALNGKGGGGACAGREPTTSLTCLLDESTCSPLSSEVVFGRVDVA